MSVSERPNDRSATQLRRDSDPRKATTMRSLVESVATYPVTSVIRELSVHVSIDVEPDHKPTNSLLKLKHSVRVCCLYSRAVA